MAGIRKGEGIIAWQNFTDIFREGCTKASERVIITSKLKTGLFKD